MEIVLRDLRLGEVDERQKEVEGGSIDINLVSLTLLLD